MELISRNAKIFGPFNQRSSFSMKRNEMSGSLVSSLFCTSSPSTIIWAIGSVIVDSIQRSLGWRFAHVSNEIRIIKPAFAHHNSTPALVFVGRAALVIASLANVAPNFITAWVSRFFATSGSSVLKIHSLVVRFLVASARRSMSPGKVARKNSDYIFTFALAHPTRSSFNVVVSKAQHREFS